MADCFFHLCSYCCALHDRKNKCISHQTSRIKAKEGLLSVASRVHHILMKIIEVDYLLGENTPKRRRVGERQFHEDQFECTINCNNRIFSHVPLDIHDTVEVFCLGKFLSKPKYSGEALKRRRRISRTRNSSKRDPSRVCKPTKGCTLMSSYFSKESRNESFEELENLLSKSIASGER